MRTLPRIGILNDLFYDLAISHDRQRCQFPFLLDEKPTVVPVGLCWQAVFGSQIVWNKIDSLRRGVDNSLIKKINLTQL
jgi:hypothetical protein